MTLEQRIEKLEQRARRWRAVSVSAAVLIGAALLLGQARAPEKPESMVLGNLTIVDEEGLPRITLAAFKEDIETGSVPVSISDPSRPDCQRAAAAPRSRATTQTIGQC